MAGCCTGVSCDVNKNLLPVKTLYFCYYAGIGSLWVYIPVYMRELGLTASETGLITGLIACLGIISRILVGNIADSFLLNPWWVFAVEPLQMFTYGIMQAAATSYGSRHTPPGMHGTVQAIISSLYFFGKGSGGLLAGVVFESWGAVTTFQGFAALSLVCMILYFIPQQCIKDIKPQHEANIDDKDKTTPLSPNHTATDILEDEVVKADTHMIAIA